MTQLRASAANEILLITMSPVLSGEAPGVQVANMAQALVELGRTVTVIEPLPGRALTPEAAGALLGFTPGFATIALSRRVHRGQSYFHALRVDRRLRRRPVDLVYSRNLRACLLPAMRGVPTVLEVHTLTSLLGHQDRWALRRLLASKGLRGVVAISQALADDLVDVLGIPADRILVAHDAVRLDSQDAAAQDSTRDGPFENGSEGDSVQVGYTGSLFGGRGVDLLLAAAARLPWMTLHLVGGPATAADALRRRLTDDPSGGDVIVHGPVSPAEARRLQSRFDVLVAPFGRSVLTDSGVDSSRWMSPMKVFEYLASGRPVVISDLPVLREVIRPDVDALMVPPDDLEALVGALVRLRDEPDLGSRLAAAALERARTEFTWELRAQRILERFGA